MDVYVVPLRGSLRVAIDIQHSFDRGIRQKALERLEALSFASSSNSPAGDLRANGQALFDRTTVDGLTEHASATPNEIETEAQTILTEIKGLVAQEYDHSIMENGALWRRAADLLCKSKRTHGVIVHHLVNVPFHAFTEASITQGISLWMKVIRENPRLESRVFTEIVHAWERSFDRKDGIFDRRLHYRDPFFLKQEFAPSNKEALLKQQWRLESSILPHSKVLHFFSNRFDAVKHGSLNTQRTFIRMLRKTLIGLKKASRHPLAREFHFNVVLLGLQIIQWNIRLTPVSIWQLYDQLISTGLCWFNSPPRWPFGNDRDRIKAEIKVLSDVLSALRGSQRIELAANKTHSSLQPKQDLLRLLIENEKSRLSVWLSPLERDRPHHAIKESVPMSLVGTAWAADPAIAIQLATRFHSEPLRQAIRFYLLNFPEKSIENPEGLEILLGSSLPTDVAFPLKYLLYWAPVNPVQAVTYFLPAYDNHPFILQYAMRTLEHHLIDATFFYVPQIVQCLRYDVLGYVEQYIIETGTSSQLFAHQIIWNMKANAYKDDDSQVPDPVKPTLDKVMQSLESSFSDEDREFYRREFSFFGEVTSISGKLKPYIKKSKPEKKAKIDEELSKIHLEVGAYLPSNPNGVVIDVDRSSGRPLQSHAKAPFMATFQIRKPPRTGATDSPHGSTEVVGTDEKQKRQAGLRETGSGSGTSGTPGAKGLEVWQSAIFKVGDDCRQDVLALQMIAAFRGIFDSNGLDVYVHPYRVTATAPGCGVIDVLPDSISRDIMGREGVQSLYDYFVDKYGGPDSTPFQEAQANFIRSMAAYSVISYLLQFKDRHNGNIMIDGAGHVLHIDFGFCFDIVPGGVKFERAPFKLTPEMMAVMGKDSSNPQPYRWFEELTVQAFLACRPYIEKLSYLVALMLDSGLPCFRAETMRNLTDRFVLEKTERGAAEFMLGCIRKSEDNYSTKIYDEFQLITNGIPY